MNEAEESNNGFGQDAPDPPARRLHRARSSLRMDPEEAAGLELENRHLRRRVAELEHALEAQHEESRPPESGKSKSPTHRLLQGLQDSSEESDEEEIRAEKRMKGIVVSGKWRKLAEGLKRFVREQDMDDIEAENEELKERVLHLEERLKQVKLEAHRLQLQVQEEVHAQNSYKDALMHAQQQVETAHMETDIQRRRVADLQEMLEQMELELSFAKMDTGPKPAQEAGKVATPETAEFDGPRVGRLSVTEEADHLANQLVQGPNEGSPVAPETLERAVRLIRHNLLMQRKLSGLLEWRSEVTVSKLQTEIDHEAGLVQQLRARESRMGGRPSTTSSSVQAELEDLRLQCAELERQLQKDSDSALAEHGRFRAELRAETDEMRLHEDKSAGNIHEVQALEMSLAEAWRAVRQESQQARDMHEESGVEQLQQQILAEQHRCQELESACEKMSMAASEAEETASRLHKLEQEMALQCQTLKDEKAELSASMAASSTPEGSAAETASLRAERLETNMKVRDLEQENEVLSRVQVEEQSFREEAAHRNAEVEEWQTRCSELEAGAQNAGSLHEQLQLKAEELTSALADLDAAKKSQLMTQELAESLEKSYKALKVEYATCQEQLSEVRQRVQEKEEKEQNTEEKREEAEKAERRAPTARISGESNSLGSTVAALRRARASLAGEALTPQTAQAPKEPASPSSPSSPSKDVSAGLKALQRLKAAAAGKPKADASAESPLSPSGSRAVTSLIANRSKANSLWLKAAQATADPDAKES